MELNLPLALPVRAEAGDGVKRPPPEPQTNPQRANSDEYSDKFLDTSQA